MSQVYEIADQYVLAYAALDPIAATDAGIAGHETELTDYSPAGAEARALPSSFCSAHSAISQESCACRASSAAMRWYARLSNALRACSA